LQILSLLEAGNREEVPSVCDALLKRLGRSTDVNQANLLAWICVLAPDAVTDCEIPVRLAEAALARCPEGEKSDVLNTLGAALYRVGRFESAIRRLDESVQTRGGEGVPKGFAFLAMAHHRLGERDEAEGSLAKLIASQAKGGALLFWDDVEIRILRREAEALILGADSRLPRPSPLSQPRRRPVIPEPSRSERFPPGSPNPEPAFHVSKSLTSRTR
jgi:hypothetical protein